MEKYYTDLLAASIMLRDHGVKLVTASGDDIVWYRDALYTKHETESTTEWRFFKDKWAYIHPYSYSIYEPQVGDLVSWVFSHSNERRYNIVTELRSNYLVLEDGYSASREEGCDIIQRDGNEFFTPEEDK